MSFWTEDRVERLESLWERGYSAGAIAELLGTSRSAVAGKAWRLDLEQEREIIYTVARRKRYKPRSAQAFRLRQPKKIPAPKSAKPAAQKAAVPRPDFSWHLAQVAAGVSPRGKMLPQPPEGFPSWRAFARRWASDAEFRERVTAAKLLRAPDQGRWVKRAA